jgi:hypothetical protein
MPKRTFLPFGEWLPDQRLFLNQGLLRAEGVVPVYGNYFVAPTPQFLGAVLPQTAYGLGVLPTSPSAWRAYVGTTSKIYEVTNAGVRTDRSGAAYATPDTTSGSQILAFGQSVIETRYTAPPNILLSGAAAFVPLHSGTFAPAGRFPFTIRGNLFLAHCSVPAPYDAVPAGANPQLVAWSQTDAPRFFGGPRVDPQYVGSDYQQIQNDYGMITGAVGGDYGLVFQQRAVVRVDGPPYTFQEIVRGKGCRYPNSIVQDEQNTYFWGPGGPTVLEYGGQLQKSDQFTTLGDGKVSRTLLDNTTSFSSYASASGMDPIFVGAVADNTNGLIFWAYTKVLGGINGANILCYNINEKRFSFFRTGPLNGGTESGILFPRWRSDTGDSWTPGQNQVFIIRIYDGATAGDFLSTWSPIGTAPATLENGYFQLDPNATTRILRVRPILSYSPSAGATVTTSLKDVNVPYGTPAVSALQLVPDGMGWYAAQSSLFTDFHSLSMVLGGQVSAVNEMKGWEIEYETGGAYSA